MSGAGTRLAFGPCAKDLRGAQPADSRLGTKPNLALALEQSVFGGVRKCLQGQSTAPLGCYVLGAVVCPVVA